MRPISYKAVVSGETEEIIERVTRALKTEGFGILTRIDLHTKIKEKLGMDLSPTVILGACNPQLAYDAYALNTDVATLLPCNVAIREVSPGKQSIELARPSAMMELLGDEKLVRMTEAADRKLLSVLTQLEGKAA